MGGLSKSDLGPLAASIGIAQGAGLIGSIFTFRSIPTWYGQLRKPREAPPNSVFGPVWTTLYTLMGIASFLVWRQGKEKPEAKDALTIYGSQLVLNSLWSFVFFGLRSLGGGIAVIAALWAAISVTIWKFSQVSGPAALMLVPYLAWTSFASFLNIRFWQLNHRQR